MCGRLSWDKRRVPGAHLPSTAAAGAAWYYLARGDPVFDPVAQSVEAHVLRTWCVGSIPTGVIVP